MPYTVKSSTKRINSYITYSIITFIHAFMNENIIQKEYSQRWWLACLVNLLKIEKPVRIFSNAPFLQPLYRALEIYTSHTITFFTLLTIHVFVKTCSETKIQSVWDCGELSHSSNDEILLQSMNYHNGISQISWFLTQVITA